jgi:hypothetical protein
MSHTGTQREGLMVRVAIGFTAWAEKWFPDAFIFVAIALPALGARFHTPIPPAGHSVMEAELDIRSRVPPMKFI